MYLSICSKYELKVIQLWKISEIILNLLKDNNKKITVSQELLDELFIVKEKIKINNKPVIVSKFDLNKNILELYKHFDFSNFTYSNLVLNASNNNIIVDAIIIYDAYNAKKEIAWYNIFSQQIPYRIPNQFINQDELLENEVKDIFEYELAIQKKKTMKSN